MKDVDLAEESEKRDSTTSIPQTLSSRHDNKREGQFVRTRNRLQIDIKKLKEKLNDLLKSFSNGDSLTLRIIRAENLKSLRASSPTNGHPLFDPYCRM